MTNTEQKISKFLDKNRQIKLVKLLFPCYYEHRNLKQQTAAKIKETIQDVLQLILQADDIKYVKNSGILNYGLDLKQVVEREIELSVCKGDKEILLAMNYDIEQCSVQFQIVDCTEEEEKKIIDLDFALNGAETAVDFTQALNLYLLSIGYIDEDNLEEYRQKVSRLS